MWRAVWCAVFIAHLPAALCQPCVCCSCHALCSAELLAHATCDTSQAPGLYRTVVPINCCCFCYHDMLLVSSIAAELGKTIHLLPVLLHLLPCHV